MQFMRTVLFAVILLSGAVANASGQVAILDSANTREFFARHYAGVARDGAV